MKTIALAIFLIILIFSGCDRVVNVETETPAGSVPPPDSVSQPPQRGDRPVAARGASDAAKAEGTYGSRIGYPDTEIMAFRTAYASQGEPRILVFLNRELSNEVREWSRQAQIKLQISKTAEKISNRTDATKSDKQTTAILRTEQPMESEGERVYPGEKWMWALEAGFVQSFLLSKANLVDYATIVRLEAQVDPGKGDPENFKKLEIMAMKKYAEIYIEILISEDEASPVGYIFKSIAKEVASGKILALVTLMNWKDLYAHITRVPTYDSQGYSLSVDQFPSVSQVAEYLAIQTMAKLTQAWND
jgi:hypothetical protein